MALFTTTLDLYGGVLRSGELQGFIIHETMPTGGWPGGWRLAAGGWRLTEDPGVRRTEDGGRRTEDGDGGAIYIYYILYTT
jgi:hypothetical protein